LKPRRHLHPSDLRAAARLATQATAGLVDLVEAVHARVARLPLIGRSDERTRGLTGLVYQTVRGVTHVVGGSVDALLGWLEPVIHDPASHLPTPEREAVIAALNGVLGDHLAASGNPLATTMALRVAGHPLVPDSAALPAALAAAMTAVPPVAPEPVQPTGRLLVLAHGLCMNDLQWQRNGHDHGAWLAQQAGWTPVYLHYNSGLHIADNGQLLSDLLARLTAAWPQPITRLALLGHSMGGLVARSAVHQGQQAGSAWTRTLTDLVCLGTPHHGAALERAGHGVDLLLQATPYSAPFARLGQVRSAGITDLRHGRLLASDGTTAARRTPVPLPAGVNCCAIAASLSAEDSSLKPRPGRRLRGDGLVSVASALGRHADAKFALGFAPERQAVVHGTGHLDLLNSPAVAAQLKHWLS
jgi:PGAP1-like protein